MLRSYLCNFSDVYIIVKENITVTKKTFTVDEFEVPNNTPAIIAATNNENNNEFGEKKKRFFKTMHHLSIVF